MAKALKRRPAAHKQYDAAAEAFAERYESLSFEQVHSGILHLVPVPPARILDVGAGSGRDAAALADRGHKVIAVEPASKMRRLARRLHPKRAIRWIDDTLPMLSKVTDLHVTFDFIIVSAVWMHLPVKERGQALKTLGMLLAEDGVLVVTLRLGADELERQIYAVDDRELERLGRNVDLKVVDVMRRARDQLGRHDINWTTVAFRKARRRNHGSQWRKKN